MGPIISQVGGEGVRLQRVTHCYSAPQDPTGRQPPALSFAIIQIRESNFELVRNRPTRCFQKISLEFQKSLTTKGGKSVNANTLGKKPRAFCPCGSLSRRLNKEPYMRIVISMLPLLHRTRATGWRLLAACLAVCVVFLTAPAAL